MISLSRAWLISIVYPRRHRRCAERRNRRFFRCGRRASPLEGFGGKRAYPRSPARARLFRSDFPRIVRRAACHRLPHARRLAADRFFRFVLRRACRPGSCRPSSGERHHGNPRDQSAVGARQARRLRLSARSLVPAGAAPFVIRAKKPGSIYARQSGMRSHGAQHSPARTSRADRAERRAGRCDGQAVVRRSLSMPREPSPASVRLKFRPSGH